MNRDTKKRLTQLMEGAQSCLKDVEEEVEVSVTSEDAVMEALLLAQGYVEDMVLLVEEAWSDDRCRPSSSTRPATRADDE